MAPAPVAPRADLRLFHDSLAKRRIARELGQCRPGRGQGNIAPRPRLAQMKRLAGRAAEAGKSGYKLLGLRRPRRRVVGAPSTTSVIHGCPELREFLNAARSLSSIIVYHSCSTFRFSEVVVANDRHPYRFSKGGIVNDPSLSKFQSMRPAETVSRLPKPGTNGQHWPPSVCP